MAFFSPSVLLHVLKPALLTQSARGHKMKAMKSWSGGVNYPGFKYYPRPGEVDPPYKPTKLFLIQRIKPFAMNTVREKRYLNSIGLGEDKVIGSYAIVKNTTDMNAKLWYIKHLIKITPITTPDGLPVNDDYSSYHLDHATGVLRIIPELKPDEKRLELQENHHNSPKKMKTDVWKKHARQQWLAQWW
ncbi:large ribosomal subunit protein uL30m [Bemisia tabaci]